MKKAFPFIALIILISISSCKKKKDDPAPVTPPATGGTPSGDYYKLGSVTYSPNKSLTTGGVDIGEDILTVSTQPVNNSLIQISAFDTAYDINAQLTSSRTYALGTSVSTWPSPSFGKATFDLVENLSMSNETVWVPTSGTLTVTKNTDGTFTCTFSNVPVKNDLSSTTTTVSGKITY